MSWAWGGCLRPRCGVVPGPRVRCLQWARRARAFAAVEPGRPGAWGLSSCPADVRRFFAGALDQHLARRAVDPWPIPFHVLALLRHGVPPGVAVPVAGCAQGAHAFGDGTLSPGAPGSRAAGGVLVLGHSLYLH